MNNFTFDEVFSKQFFIKDKIISGIEIEREIKKYLSNIEIKLEAESSAFTNQLYVYGNYKSAHCRISLEKDFLFLDYENYLKNIAFEIQHFISKEYFLKGEENE